MEIKLKEKKNETVISFSDIVEEGKNVLIVADFVTASVG
jgi:hypothetical protein